MTVDEILIIEGFKLKNFLRLGYSVYDAKTAIDNNVDWHEVEALIDKGCDLPTALKIAS